MRYSSTISLTLAMGWVVNSTPRPLYPRERPGTHRIGGWVGPRVGLEGWGKSRPPTTGIRSPNRRARSQSLYRLSYPVSRLNRKQDIELVKNISDLNPMSVRTKWQPKNIWRDKVMNGLLKNLKVRSWS